MEERKIIKFGNSSYIVTLPYTWIKKNNLEKGDKINITENKNNIVISKENAREEKNATIHIDNKPLKFFNRELISYYLKNYNTIKIEGENVIEKLEEIKIFKEKLSSVEIVEINKNYIVLKDLTNPSELNVCKLINDIIDMEKVFFDELSEEEEGNKYYFLSSLDSNVNKLSFLAFKALNYNLDSLNDSEQIKNTIYYWRIVNSFEALGDILKRISRYLKDNTPEQNYEISKVLKDIKKFYDFVTNLLDKNIKIENNIKLYHDKKQSMLKEFDFMREKFDKNINQYLVLSQLFKDLIGQLDAIILSVIDLNTK